MNVQPETQKHGAAWSAFVASTAVSGRLLYAAPGTNDAATLRYGWLCFLAGWLGKARQHDKLKG